MYSGSEGDCFNFSSFNDSISFNFGNEDQESFQDTIFQDFSARFRHLGIDSQKVYDLVIKQMEFTEMTGNVGKFSHRGQGHQADGAHRNDRQARLVLTERSRS